MYGRIRRVCLFLFETRRIHAEKSTAVITCTRSVLLKLKRPTFGSKLNITIKGFPKCNFFFQYLFCHIIFVCYKLYTSLLKKKIIVSFQIRPVEIKKLLPDGPLFEYRVISSSQTLNGTLLVSFLEGGLVLLIPSLSRDYA